MASNRGMIVREFLVRHQDQIIGVLSGFDRVLFRGSAIGLGYLKGMDQKLLELGIRYDRFFSFVKRVSQSIADHARKVAEEQKRPLLHLNSAKASKEDIARHIQQKDGIQSGLICVLTCVEQCQTYSLRRRGEKNWLQLVSERRKCQFIYFYLQDPEFGLMHVRLQTWLPMTIQVCINGREYLARQLSREGIGFKKCGNCFTQIDDMARAQQLLDQLVTHDWMTTLNAIAERFNPWCAPNNDLTFRGYYWTIRESELATDIMFRDAASLARVYPTLVRHALDHFHSPDVLRFFNRRLTARFGHEINTDFKEFPEGVRIKHWVEENSIKMYDKHGSVLRVETTLNEPCRFKVRRVATRQGREVLAWFHLRKGVVDIERRVEICRAANERYLEALAVVAVPTPAKELLDPVSRPVVRQGRRYRALRPLAPDDAKLLEQLLSGDFAIQGFRNRDVYSRLYSNVCCTPDERRRISNRITRSLRLFRAHGLIRKVSHTTYYRVSRKGHLLISTATKLRNLSLAQISL
jgi:hypothetical protein